MSENPYRVNPAEIQIEYSVNYSVEYSVNYSVGRKVDIRQADIDGVPIGADE